MLDKSANNDKPKRNTATLGRLPAERYSAHVRNYNLSDHMRAVFIWCSDIVLINHRSVIAMGIDVVRTDQELLKEVAIAFETDC